MSGLCLVGENAKIIIRVNDREFPSSNDYWDGNWLKAHIEIEIPGFKASFPASLRNEDFASFLTGVIGIDDHLSGFAELKTMEDAIHLRGEINKSGKISWTGNVVYPMGFGACLTFTFENDQTYLSDLRSRLEEIIKEFPVRGARG